MKVRQNPSVKLPHQAEVEGKLLRLLLGTSHPIATLAAYTELAEYMKLTLEQTRAIYPNTGRSAWEYLVRQAKRRLKDEGWLYCPKVGLWALTKVGVREAQLRERAPTLTAEELGL